MTPGERKQILDDARAYDQRNKQRKTEACKKGDSNCDTEKPEPKSPSSNGNTPKNVPNQEKNQNL